MNTTPHHGLLYTAPPLTAEDEAVLREDAGRIRLRRRAAHEADDAVVAVHEGRGWRGFHHHATLCVAAYGFLISEKETIPPSGHPRTWRGPQSSLPISYRPRGSAAAFATPHAELNRNPAYPPHADFGARTATMSLLRTDAAEGRRAE